MALTRPILSPVNSFDSRVQYEFLFNSIGGSQITKHNISIIRNSDSVEIYNATTESFQFKHILPQNILTNNIQYKARLRTGDVYGNWSDFSDFILFYCYQPADVSITNLIGGIANNQTYTFVGSYIPHGDIIKSYLFILYDENGVELDVSPITYSTTIQAEFTLQNQTNYKIELKTYSQSGVTISSGLISFMAVYLAPTMGAELQLTNLSEQGSVEIELIAVDREGTGNNYTFENSEWVKLTSAGAIVRFSEGLNTIINNYSLRLHLKNITTNTTFLQIISGYGNIIVKYYENRFHAWQTALGLTSHFISNTDITITTSDMVCVEIKVVNGLIDVLAEKYT